MSQTVTTGHSTGGAPARVQPAAVQQRQPTAAPSNVRTAIAQAADRTGVDFSYLLAQAQLESGLNPQARASTSSATGLFQFIDQTWLGTLDRHGEALGYGQYARAITVSGGRAQITDPAMRSAIFQLRLDPQAASLMAGALASDNSAALRPVLGREPDSSELYLAHFLGASGAREFLTTLRDAPDTIAANMMPAAAHANRPIFYHESGAARTVAEVMGVLRNRVARAMGNGESLPGVPSFDPRRMADSGAGEFAPDPYSAMMQTSRGGAAQAGGLAPIPGLLSAPPVANRPRPSMADTLRSSFGGVADDGSGPGRAIAHVRTAYARLEAFGL